MKPDKKKSRVSGHRNIERNDLNNSIDELEQLITEKDHIYYDEIPVLEDEVDPENYEHELVEEKLSWKEGLDEDLSETGLTQEQLELLIGSMDQRISGELDELVNILKDAIKESIITEIKTRLSSKPDEPDTPGD